MAVCRGFPNPIRNPLLCPAELRGHSYCYYGDTPGDRQVLSAERKGRARLVLGGAELNVHGRSITLSVSSHFTASRGARMADEPVHVPGEGQPGVGAFVAGWLVFRILNSLHWALAGGLGWGFGTAVGGMVQLPGAATVGGAIGLALALFAVLTIGLGQRTEHTPITLALFGGAAAGSASLTLLSPLAPELNLALGGGLGIFVGLCSSVMRQYLARVRVVPAFAIAVAGATPFAGIGSLIGGPFGWAAAGGVSLFGVAMLSECFRAVPAVEIDADEKPVRVIPRREMIRQIARQSWSLTDPLAWGWHGVLGGLMATLWALWTADHPDTGAVHKPFLVCGGLAAAVIVAMRLGILKPPRQTQPASNAS
jgi:hypothetical protein